MPCSGVLALLGFALAAVRRKQQQRERRARRRPSSPPATAPPDNAKKGGTLNVIAAGDVDYIDPGAAYYQFTYMVTAATQRGLLGWAPDDIDEPDAPTSRTASRRSRATTRPSPSRSSPGSGTARRSAVAPESNRPVTSADVKYAIERRSCRASPTATRALLRRDRGLQAGPGGRRRRTRPWRRTSAASRRPTTRRSSSSSTNPTGRSGRAGAVAADQRSRSGGVREEVRRREPFRPTASTSSRPVRTT